MTLIAFRGHLFVVLRLFIFLRVMNSCNKKVTFLRHVSKYGPNIHVLFVDIPQKVLLFNCHQNG